MTSRTPAEAIAAVQRHGLAITEEQRAAAVALLTDLYATAAREADAVTRRTQETQ